MRASNPRVRIVAGVVGLVLALAACSDATSTETATDSSSATESTGEAEAVGATQPDSAANPSATESTDTASSEPATGTGIDDFGDPPAVPDEFDPEVADALDVVFGPGLEQTSFAGNDREQMTVLADSGDPRVAWLLADLLRFIGPGDAGDLLTSTASKVTGLQLDGPGSWNELVNHLIAWDTPAPPDYVAHKRALYSLASPSWAPFFDDSATDVDYRYWSWGGVGIDDRPYDETDEACNCIPAADNPDVTDAEGGDWYDDDRVVFGVEINGEARAYPRNIMEIREMVNDTLGGRDFAMPYCTLCGSAQVYYTDDLPDGVERPVMRTSGLLTRSNKVMYDINSQSVFDTFKGEAVTGPLAEQGVALSQAAVVTTTWGEWKEQYPDTTILDESLANGRDSDLLNTRDADGPIFPIGEVDPRLGVQDPVLGVITGDGTPVAFDVEAARQAVLDGKDVSFGDVSVKLDAGGVKAVDAAGDDLPGHQAFWFAWSQFYPYTELWTG